MTERIELDISFTGRERLTHYPSEVSKIRQPYMTDATWRYIKRKFIGEYPNAVQQTSVNGVSEND